MLVSTVVVTTPLCFSPFPSPRQAGLVLDTMAVYALSLLLGLLVVIRILRGNAGDGDAAGNRNGGGGGGGGAPQQQQPQQQQQVL